MFSFSIFQKQPGFGVIVQRPAAFARRRASTASLRTAAFPDVQIY